MKAAIITAVVLVLGTILLLAGTSCPVDGASGYFTGNTQTISGVLMKEYRCPSGHTWLTR